MGKRHTISCYSTNIKHRRKRWKCNQAVAAVCLVATCSFVSGRVHAWLQCQLHRRPNTNTSKNQALVGLNVTIDCNHHVCLVNIKLSLSYLSIAVKGENSLVSDFLEVPLVAWQLQGYETGNNFFALKTELVFFLSSVKQVGYYEFWLPSLYVYFIFTLGRSWVSNFSVFMLS